MPNTPARRVLIGTMLVMTAGVLIASASTRSLVPVDGSIQPATDIASLIAAFEGERVFTRPSRDAIIGFQVTTEVMAVAVKGGQEVKLGDLLVQGDDREEQSLLLAQTMRAQTDLPIRRAQEQAELAKVEFENQKIAQERGGGSEQELRRSEVAMRIAQLDVEQASMNAQQEKIQVTRFETRVARYALTAPFDGVVDQATVDVGDTVGAGDPVVRVVSIDPLKIDVHTPVTLSLTMGLVEGGEAWALVDMPGAPAVVKGIITEVSPVADFASKKQRITIEIPNPRHWPAGLGAWVRFTAPGEAFEGLLIDADATVAPQSLEDGP